MASTDVILDFDDFREDENSLDYLYRLRAKFPNFKVTLFTIPAKCSPEFLKAVKEIPWIQMAVHGHEHSPVECETWKQHEARTFLQHDFEAGGIKPFVRGFKAPQWRMSQGTIAACQELGFWVANNAEAGSNPNNCHYPDELPQYFANGSQVAPGIHAGKYHREHGHIGCLVTNNDIRQYWHYLLTRIPHDANFHFIDDVMKELYPKLRV